VIASSPTGDVTLSLPQSIATTSDVTFGSVAFSPTTKGIVGTATNNNASAGYVGEFISSNIAAGSATSLTTNTPKNITSISLTAGDWDVWGNATFIYNAATEVSNCVCAINSTSAALPDDSLFAIMQLGNAAAGVTLAVTQLGLCAPSRRFSLSGTTTIYIVAQSSFVTNTGSVCGGIYARRVR